MTVYEFILLNRYMLDAINNASIELKDIKYICLFEEYNKMLSEGFKMTFSISSLSEKYSVSERQVYRIINKFSKSIEL